MADHKDEPSLSSPKGFEKWFDAYINLWKRRWIVALFFTCWLLVVPLVGIIGCAHEKGKVSALQKQLDDIEKQRDRGGKAVKVRIDVLCKQILEFTNKWKTEYEKLQKDFANLQQSERDEKISEWHRQKSFDFAMLFGDRVHKAFIDCADLGHQSFSSYQGFPKNLDRLSLVQAQVLRTELLTAASKIPE